MRLILVILSATLSFVLFAGAICAARMTYTFTFDHPMSWADDVCPLGEQEIQNWEVADGGNPGKALRISAAVYKQPTSCEVRTLQFNHKPDTSVTISFDVKASCAPPESRVLVRYFDGYCGALPFVTIADEDYAPFPPPFWDSAKAKLTDDWLHVSFSTPKLKNSVITLAIIVEQRKATDEKYIEYYFDNLSIQTELLDKLMDPGFEWHGNYGGSTSHFWRNTGAANSDWCDYADQEDVITKEGVIHYTMYQFRHTSACFEPAIMHELCHERFSEQTGVQGTVVTSRIHASACAASWGVRQTISYGALGLKPEDTARIQIKMRYTNHEPVYRDTSRVQLGVDPMGHVITQSAIWGEEDNVNFLKEGWHTGVLEFEKPRGAQAFTIYFRHRDGLPKPGGETPHEAQSRGTDPGCRGIADWVIVRIVDKTPNTLN